MIFVELLCESSLRSVADRQLLRGWMFTCTECTLATTYMGLKKA